MGFVVLVAAVAVVAVVGLIAGVVVADQNHRAYRQASALRRPSAE